MARRALLASLPNLLLALLFPATAFAQAAVVPEGVGVADRDRPEYHPVGGRIGSFFLYPTVGLSVDATDNAKATTSNRIGDVYAVVSARAKLQSIFSRHALNVQLFGDRSFHSQVESDDATRYGGQIDGLYDIARDAKLSAQVFAEHAAEARSTYTSPLGARAPGRFDRLSARLQGQKDFGRWSLTGAVIYRAARYDGVTLDSGAVLDQRYRDLAVHGASLVLGYRARPGTSVILRASADETNYRLAAGDPRQPANLDRDSKGFRVEGGLRFDLTSLLYGEARVGYFKRDFADPRLLTASGLSFGADLLWNVTPLTSLRLEADRRIDEASSTTIAANRTTEVGLSVDHELLRNLILSSDVRYRRIKPLGPVDASRETYAGAGGRMLVTRWLSLRAAYRHAHRTSPVIGRSFTETHATLGAQLTF